MRDKRQLYICLFILSPWLIFLPGCAVEVIPYSVMSVGSDFEAEFTDNDLIVRMSLVRAYYRGERQWECRLTFSGAKIAYARSDYEAESKGYGATPTKAIEAAVKAWEENE